jgi:2-isopropylmalate synthase
VTINGIGERAGNTALEEFVMALRTRHSLIQLQTHVDSAQICKISKLVSTRTGVVVQPNKAIVGANAFAHEAGIHQDGILKHQATYEIMRPETVGAAKSVLVLGKHSGRHAFGVRLRELGFALSDEAMEAAFARFKVLADRKKNITDADLEALAADEVDRGPERYTLDAVQVTCGTSGLPTASVRLHTPDGKQVTGAAIGTGPVHAVFTAIDQLLGAPAELIEYSINAVTEGIDALGEANVRVQAKRADKSRVNPQHASLASIFHGHAADTDILVASTKAYLVALNRLLSATDSADARGPFSERPEPGASV